MNITDIAVEAPPSGADDVGFWVGDMLQNMCRRQFELEQKYEEIERANGLFIPPELANGLPLDLDKSLNQWFLKDAAYRQIEELSEATNCLKNKPWKVTQVATDQTHFLEEMADAIHFFIRMFVYIAGDPDKAAEMMYRLYFKKSEVNKFRQETKY